MDAKYSLYLQTGNMEDINSMDIHEFNNLYKYVERRDKMQKKEPVALRQSNIDMINRTKNKGIK
jgi:hypothetical protein